MQCCGTEARPAHVMPQLGIEERLQRRTRRTPAEFTAAAAAAEARWALADWKPFEPVPGIATAAGDPQPPDALPAQLLPGPGGWLRDTPLDPAASAAPAQPRTASHQAVSGRAVTADTTAAAQAATQVPNGSPIAAAAPSDQQRQDSSRRQQDGGGHRQCAPASEVCRAPPPGDSGGGTAGQVDNGELSRGGVTWASDVDSGEVASGSIEGLQLDHIQT